MELSKKKFLYAISFILLGTCFFTNFITVIGFLLHLSITKYNFPIAILISAFLITFLLKNKKITLVLSIITSIIIITISIYFASAFYDMSYDGMHYHLTSVVELLNGWNPIYNQLSDGWTNQLCNAFAGKGIWYVSASIAKFIGNINAGKAYHIIMAVSCLSISFATFYKHNNTVNKLLSGLLCCLIALNPILLYQYTTNYADSYLYSIGVCLICILINIGNNNRVFEAFDKIYIIMCISILCNIKFTGIFFAGAIYGIFYIKWFWQILNLRRFKEIINVTIPGFMGLFMGAFIGINPYLTNILVGRNIFFPMLGKGKIDLLSSNIPIEIKNKGTIGKLLHVIFSDSQGKLKLPFIINVNSFNNLGSDLRYEGFGILFSLLFAIAFIIIVIALIRLKRNMLSIEGKNLLYLIIAILLIAVIFPESWWSRYYPFLWLVPIFASFIILEEYKNMLASCLISIFVTIFLINNLILGSISFQYFKQQSDYLKQTFNQIKSQKVSLVVVDEELFGRTTRFLLNEKKIKFIDEEKGNANNLIYQSYYFSLYK
jgi:hypothetical protein